MVVDMRPLSRSERLADDVQQLRDRGMLWKDICRLLHCGNSTAMSALNESRRYISSTSATNDCQWATFNRGRLRAVPGISQSNAARCVRAFLEQKKSGQTNLTRYALQQATFS